MENTGRKLFFIIRVSRFFDTLKVWHWYRVLPRYFDTDTVWASSTTDPEEDGQAGLVDEPVGGVDGHMHRRRARHAHAEAQLPIGRLDDGVALHRDGLELVHVGGQLQRSAPVQIQVVQQLPDLNSRSSSYHGLCRHEIAQVRYFVFDGPIKANVDQIEATATFSIPLCLVQPSNQPCFNI